MLEFLNGLALTEWVMKKLNPLLKLLGINNQPKPHLKQGIIMEGNSKGDFSNAQITGQDQSVVMRDNAVINAPDIKIDEKKT